jgi:hypothetical protein
MPVYCGQPDLDHDDDDVAKSRHACAAPHCARGPSVGYRITFVNKPDEPRRGYCSKHLEKYGAEMRRR